MLTPHAECKISFEVYEQTRNVSLSQIKDKVDYTMLGVGGGGGGMKEAS